MDYRPYVRRPIVGIAITASMGMLLASTGLITAPILLIPALLSLIVSAMYCNRKGSAGAVFLTVSLIAALRFLLALPSLPADSINHRKVALKGQQVELVGIVSGIPEFFAYGSDGLGSRSFSFQGLELGVSNHWKKIAGEIEVRIFSVPPQVDFETGEKLKLKGVISLRDFPGKNELELNVGPDGFRVLEKAKWPSLRTVAEKWRSSVAPKLEQGMEDFPTQESVLKALVLGYRDDVPKETTAAFKRTGSMHIFAISGLHVGIVGFLLAMVLKVMGVPRDKMGLILIPILGMYVVSTGMKSSALRALLMAVIYLLSPLFRRKPDIPTSVAVAALILLFFQPLEILSPGFIFSFSVVTILVMTFGAMPRHWMQGAWIKRYVVSLVVTSIAAGAVAVPMAALFFGQFSPVALVGNLIVVPLTFCIVLCGWLSILVPFCAEIFNAAATVFIDLLLGSVNLLDRLPGSSFSVQPPPLLAVLLWYAGLIALFTACRNPKQKWAAAGISVLGLVLALVS